MQKALLFAGSLLLFAACTEKGYEVTPRVEGGDTTYMTTVEPAQQRTVMIEEFTGVTCPNCPTGHAIISNLLTQNPGRLIPVSYYANGLPQAEPVEGLTQQDFRTTDATDIGSSIFGGVAGLPSAGIDRVPVNNTMLQYSNSWPGAVAARLGVASPANVTVTSEWQDASRTAIVRVRVAYTGDVAKKQALTVLLAEDDVVDAQEYPDTIVSAYTFKHVLRDAITTTTGEPMLDEFATKEAGRVYERTFVYPVPDTWNADKCKLIAIVHNAESGDREVVQAAEAELKD